MADTELKMYMAKPPYLCPDCADDLAELETLDRHNKQTWAELLAHRLCWGRTTAPAGTAEGGRQPGRQQQDTRSNDE
jgi:hypothetical protein